MTLKIIKQITSEGARRVLNIPKKYNEQCPPGKKNVNTRFWTRQNDKRRITGVNRMNIFNKIGNQIEKKKKDRKNFQDKYWKLSASERIDYDNKLKRINNSPYVFIFTATLLKGIFWIAAFFYLISLYIGETILIPTMLLLAYLFGLIPIFLFIDAIYLALNMNKKDEQKRTIKQEV